MKLCTFLPTRSALLQPRLPGERVYFPRTGGRVGVALEDRWVLDLGLALLSPSVNHALSAAELAQLQQSGTLTSMLALLNAGPTGFDSVRRLLAAVRALTPSEHETLAADGVVLRLDQLRLGPPVPRPASLRDCMAFELHFLQAMRGGARLTLPRIAQLDALTRKVGLPLIRTPKLFRELPAYYKGNPASVIGPDEVVQWPAYSQRMDYELEVGLFIYQTGKSLSPQQALQHIAGYTIFNDFSARDAQLQEMKLRLGPAKGKDFDTGNAMGPWLVTPDEVGNPSDLRCRAYINGTQVTDSSTRTLQFPVEEILRYISQNETLYPGDFIGLGTVPNGCGMEHGRFLEAGDTVRLEVDKLGSLQNQLMKV